MKTLVLEALDEEAFLINTLVLEAPVISKQDAPHTSTHLRGMFESETLVLETPDAPHTNTQLMS